MMKNSSINFDKVRNRLGKEVKNLSIDNFIGKIVKKEVDDMRNYSRYRFLFEIDQEIYSKSIVCNKKNSKKIEKF